jgi:hypothetical protein
MIAFFNFIASPAGRVVRIVAGLILIAADLWWVNGIGGSFLVIAGLALLLAGFIDRCVLAPLFGLPFVGSSLRSALSKTPV